jgi:hypothetical protein
VGGCVGVGGRARGGAALLLCAPLVVAHLHSTPGQMR